MTGITVKDIRFLQKIEQQPVLFTKKSAAARNLIETGYAVVKNYFVSITENGKQYLLSINNDNSDTIFCSKCSRFRIPSEFYISKQTRSGLTSRCKDCINSYARERHAVEKRKERARDRMRKDVDPDYVNRRAKASRKYYASEYGKARNLWLSAKKSKASKRMDFTLTFEHVLEGVQRGTCAVTGLKFDLTPSTIRYRNAYAPSLDRIDPKGPYSNENVRVILNQLNAMKGEISDIELYVIAKAFVNRIEGIK